MSEPALAVAFFDPAGGLHGSIRAGVALVFDGASARALADAPALEGGDGSFRARAGEALDVTLEPVGAAVELGSQRTWLCRVSGRAEGRSLRCLGTATETFEPPRWEELDALRGVSAVFAEDEAVLYVASRPRGALGHGAEQARCVLVSGGERFDVEEARLSTVYDGEARQRSAGLELWLPGESFPRRAFGTVAAGTTLHLEQLRVNAAVFTWRMDGRVGAGAYDVVVREPTPAAA